MNTPRFRIRFGISMAAKVAALATGAVLHGASAAHAANVSEVAVSRNASAPARLTLQVTSRDAPSLPGKIAFATDRNGAVRSVVVTPEDGERLIVTGDAIAFAEGATITFLAPGELEFQSAVTSAGDITVIRPDAGAPQYLEWRAPSGVTIDGDAYKKIFSNAGTLDGEISLVGFETADGAYTVVSNRPYAVTSSDISGIPSGDYCYQMSVGNLWDGTTTKSLRLQLAQPDGTGDIYARIPAYTTYGGNLFNSPDPRNETGVETTSDGATLAQHAVTRIVLARKGKGFATVRFHGATDLNGGAVVYKVRESSDAYIQSDGTARIATPFYMQSGGNVNIDYEFTELLQNNDYLIGGSNLRLWLSGSSPAMSFAGGSTVYSGKNAVAGRRCVMTVKSDGSWIDVDHDSGSENFSKKSSDELGGAGTYPLYLFGWHNAANYSKAKIYRVTFAINGAVVHDYLPAVKEGIAGFYDEVGGGFIHGGSSANKFTAGGDAAALPDDPYIRGDGTSLIVTDFCMAPNVAVEFAYALDEVTSGARIIGGGGLINYLSGTSPTMVYGDGTSETKGSGKNADTAKHLVTMTPDGVWTDVNPTTGSVNYTKTFSKTITYTMPYAIHLFGSHNSDVYAKAKIYYATFTTNGVAVAHFVPAVVGGVAGFKDTVGGKFFKGETPSAFTAGGGVEKVENEPYDAYIQSDGTSRINTGFKMKPGVRIDVDYEYTGFLKNSDRLFGGSGALLYLSGTVPTLMYGDGLADNIGSTFSGLQTGVRYHTTVTPEGRWIDTNYETGVTNYDRQASTSITTEGANPLYLYGWHNSGNYSKAKIYRFTLTVDGAVAYDFIPAEVNGVAGFTNAVGGAFVSGASASAFSFGCSWREGSGMGADMFTTVPADTTVSKDRTTTLTAAMPGADSYEWLKNGEVIAGSTGASLSVGWRSGLGTDVYSVRAVKTVAGTTIRSDAVSATIEFLPSAFVMVVW